jgi:hypothetical protein
VTRRPSGSSAERARRTTRQRRRPVGGSGSSVFDQ